MPAAFLVLIGVAVIAFPLPWLRGLAFHRKMEELLANPRTSAETREAIEQGLENLSIILVLGFKAPLVCFILIVLMMGSMYS
jgi:hypothetical protein